MAFSLKLNFLLGITDDGTIIKKDDELSSWTKTDITDVASLAYINVMRISSYINCSNYSKPFLTYHFIVIQLLLF